MVKLTKLIEYESGIKNIDSDIIKAIEDININKIDFIAVNSPEYFISLNLEDSCKQLWFIDYINNSEQLTINKDHVEQKAEIVINFLKSKYNLEKDNTIYLIIKGSVVSIYLKPYV